jgi:hypothetical protein
MWGWVIIIFIILIWHHWYCEKKQAIRSLIRQVYRWHIASTQDANPIVKMLHSNYATGYIGALRSIATENEILLTTGLSIVNLEAEVTTEQDKALAMFAKQCPEILPMTPEYKKYLDQYIKQL